MKERGLRSRGFRRLISEALDAFAERVEDDLPAALRQRLGLAELGISLRQVHFPASLAEAERARQRLAFGELFAFQLRLARRRKKTASQADASPSHPAQNWCRPCGIRCRLPRRALNSGSSPRSPRRCSAPKL